MRFLLALALIALIALPGLAVGLNRLARRAIDELVDTQQQVDQWQQQAEPDGVERQRDFPRQDRR